MIFSLQDGRLLLWVAHALPRCWALLVWALEVLPLFVTDDSSGMSCYRWQRSIVVVAKVGQPMACWTGCFDDGGAGGTRAVVALFAAGCGWARTLTWRRADQQKSALPGKIR